MDARATGGKKWIFGDEDKYDLSSAACRELKEKILRDIESLKRGDRPLYVYMDCLKDELLPIEKVKAGKTRLISVSPVDYTILVRMFFMSFTRFVMQLHPFVKYGVGTNVYSADWDVIAHTLNNKSPMFIAGDFSGFDARGQPQVYQAALEIVQGWYSAAGRQGEDAVVREALWREVYQSRHVVGTQLYQWFQALPSGHPMTVVINSIVSRLMFLSAWSKLTDIPCSEFDDYVEMYVYGDDNILAVSPTVIQQFNQNTLAGFFLEYYDIVYTDDKKSGKIMPDYRSLEEVSFLKRGFRYESAVGRFVAPLDLDVILEMICWYKKNPLGSDVVKQVVDQALAELALHGEDVYTKYAFRLISASELWLQYAPLEVAYTRVLKRVCEQLESWSCPSA
ncbi:MAG: RNA-dependent RNA polymerase family protein, partial [Candidatus Bathyarchaeota archaeon]|nr:RNA-dependent RNA polymerase family protein [Candidatus Bathyarchaeota archaeon]